MEKSDYSLARRCSFAEVLARDSVDTRHRFDGTGGDVRFLVAMLLGMTRRLGEKEGVQLANRGPESYDVRPALPVPLCRQEVGEMSLKISTKQMEGVTVVHCNGRIVFGEEAATLREQVKNLLMTQKNIVLNLGGVSYIDSGGLGILVSLYTSARAAGADIKLANLTQRVGDLLQITKLLTVFDVHEGEQKAIDSFKKTVHA